MTLQSKYPYCTFQSSNINYKKTQDCQHECNILYDQHHDQYFCLTCGTVIMQSNHYETEYYSDPCFWEKYYAQKRKTEKEKQNMRGKK